VGHASRIVLRRLVAAVPTVALVTIAAWAVLEAAPGDAADAYLAQTGGDAGFAAELRRRLGLGGAAPERLDLVELGARARGLHARDALLELVGLQPALEVGGPQAQGGRLALAVRCAQVSGHPGTS